MIGYIQKMFMRRRVNRTWERAKANYEHAVRRGDTRAQAWCYQVLRAATNQRLKVGL